VKRSSKAHSIGCFAKKFYDLPKANLSRTEECPKSGHSPTQIYLCSDFEIPQSGIMEARLKNQRFFNRKFVLALKLAG
jgi:hypothetical protein